MEDSSSYFSLTHTYTLPSYTWVWSVKANARSGALDELPDTSQKLIASLIDYA